MTRSELINELVLRNPCFSQNVIEDAVRLMLDRITEALADGDKIENGVMPVEPRRRDRGDEELRTVGAVRLAVAAATQTGVRHGQQIRAVEDQIGDDLIIELVARAAGAVALSCRYRNCPYVMPNICATFLLSRFL